MYGRKTASLGCLHRVGVRLLAAGGFARATKDSDAENRVGNIGRGMEACFRRWETRDKTDYCAANSRSHRFISPSTHASGRRCGPKRRKSVNRDDSDDDGSNGGSATGYVGEGGGGHRVLTSRERGFLSKFYSRCECSMHLDVCRSV